MPRCLISLAIVAGALGQNSRTTGERCHEILTTALKDKNPDIRNQAVIALSIAAQREPLVSMLESKLDDKDVEVRLTTIASLLDLRNKRTGAALRRALQDDVPEVSFAAAKALWSLNDAAGKQALLSVLSGQSKTSSGFFSKQKRETLRMMQTPRTMFLFALKEGASFAPIPGAGAGVSSMQALLSDPGVSGRASAALLLSREHDASTLQALREALSDKDWSVRAAAVHSLALRNDPALQKDLTVLLDDKKEAVRLRAAAAYLRLDSLTGRRRTARK